MEQAYGFATRSAYEGSDIELHDGSIPKTLTQQDLNLFNQPDLRNVLYDQVHHTLSYVMANCVDAYQREQFIAKVNHAFEKGEIIVDAQGIFAPAPAGMVGDKKNIVKMVSPGLVIALDQHQEGMTLPIKIDVFPSGNLEFFLDQHDGERVLTYKAVGTTVVTVLMSM